MAEHKAVSIRLLESEPNARGDLFTRLTEDLLLVLGYESLRTNVHHAGREIDVVARHRTENRHAIVECKATKDLIGGDALNKFYGALDIERRRAEDVPVEGYFVSLSGFKGTAVEQELDAAASRFVLMDGDQVAAQLVKGGTLVDERKAAAIAASIDGRPADAELLDLSELLGCRLGWVWRVTFGTAGVATHFALVHASGAALPREIALEVVAQDEQVGGPLGELELLSPPSRTPDAATAAQAMAAHDAYLREEFGYITLEGLPADQDLGSRRIALNDLFVPVSLKSYVDVEEDGPVAAEEIRTALESADDEAAAGADPAGDVHGPPNLRTRIPVQTALDAHRHIAVLAAPGGGKSTLLKHLATRSDQQRTTAGSTRRLCLMIRCRQLRDANAPLTETLKAIPQRGEFPHLGAAFESLLEEALLSGQLTVLVDGLDEIADDGGRVAFAAQLRTFSSLYPDVQLIVTSRPGGYRVVAGVLAPICERFRIADFDDDDILALTKAWHRAVVGPSAQVQEDAIALAERIVSTDRVRLLATNPLLLTTLLLVKRWVGDLPRKRSVLYQRAIEVLLMTWNVEGHEPIEQDEALPQLAYVAYEMTVSGEQTISEPRLRLLLRQAREAMPDILGYSKVGIAEFIRRIEDRSSVLSLSGHVEEAGRVVAQYEFKHLTFQEYLTALAVTDRFCAPRLEGATLVETLGERFTRADWSEIIPLAAVLAGREAGSLVQHLIEMAQQNGEADGPVAHRPIELLARSLADEVQITPPLAREAVREVFRERWDGFVVPYYQSIFDSRFGSSLDAQAAAALHAGGDDLGEYSSLIDQVAANRFMIPSHSDVEIGTWAKDVSLALRAQDWIEQAYGCLAVMHVSFNIQFGVDGEPMQHIDTTKAWLESCSRHVVTQLSASQQGLSYCAAWALAWLGTDSLIPAECRATVVRDSLALWADARLSKDHRRVGAWTFSAVPLVQRDPPELAANREQLTAFALHEFQALERPSSQPGTTTRHRAALTLAYYLRGPWSDAQLVKHCRALPDNDHQVTRRLLEALERASPSAPAQGGRA